MARAKILIIEDEGIVALNIQNRLEGVGYAVTANVASGEEAIQKAAETHPDLVLVDIKLKGRIDGIEAASKIQTRLNIPVVYLTAYTDDDTLQRAKLTEPYGYILKPFEARDLFTTIEIALHKHQMEQQLRFREQWLATTLKSIGDAVITTDQAGAITFMNPVAEALTRWKQEEVVGNHLNQVFRAINKQTRQAVNNLVEKVLQEGVTVNLENHTLLITKDGTEIPIDDSAAPIKRDDGTIMGAVLVFHDIIERQQDETLLQRANEELEARLTDSTTQLRQANEQLQQELTQRQLLATEVQVAVEKEQELRAFISRLMTTLSHEYRTPLTTISLSTGLLAEYGENLTESRKRQHFQRIRSAVQRMTKLADNMLFLHQASTGQLEFNPTPVNIEQRFREWIEEFASATPQHSIIFEFQGIRSRLLLDEKFVEFIFNNLLSNAIKYSPKGGVIQVELTCEQHQVTFRISDHGIGIPSADIAHLFNPFHRGSNASVISGVGLGLAIVKKCVDLHGGEIQVNSEEGVGTRFTVILPSAESVDVQAENSRE